MTLEDFWESFKAVSYGLGHMGAVVYVDFIRLPEPHLLPAEFGRPLVFSGVSVRMTPSTINDADHIVAKILAQEQLKITERDFYDLQTWKGYQMFEIGQFVLNKLCFKRNTKKVCVESWKEVKSVPHIFFDLFYPLLSEIKSRCANISRQGTF